MDEVSIATDGFLNYLGQTEAFQIATGGYIEIEEYAPGKFTITPNKRPSFSPGTIEEDEEILLIINLFLQSEYANGLFT